MIVQHSESGTETDESDVDQTVNVPPQNIYRRKYQLLLERCEVLQQDNDRLSNRIQETKKLTKRFKKDINLLTEKLDTYGDNFRSILIDETAAETQEIPVITPQASINQPDKQNAGRKKQVTKRKGKADRPEKDPNAPKKPCNAYFQFCQEQRPLVTIEANFENGVELSKQEITRQLAHRWRSMSDEDKRVYVAMFEKSKEKYAEQMLQYKSAKKQNEPQQQ